MTRTHAQVPRYIQIADDLRIAIERGELAPGDTVPSLAELEARYGVSEAVARGAIRSLKAQGFVATSQGRRPTVRRQHVEVAKSNLQWTEGKKAVRGTEEERRRAGTLEALTGRSIDSDDTDFKAIFTETIADENVIGFTPGTPVLHREYRTTDRNTSILLLWSESWLPLELAAKNPDLLDQEREPWAGGTLHQLWTVGVEVMQRSETVTARQASTVEAQHWATQPGAPLLVVDFTATDQDNQLVASGRSIFPGDRASLQYVLDLPSFDELDRQAPRKEG